MPDEQLLPRRFMQLAGTGQFFRMHDLPDVMTRRPKQNRVTIEFQLGKMRRQSIENTGSDIMNKLQMRNQPPRCIQFLTQPHDLIGQRA